MPSIKFIEDSSGEVFYPATHERGVRDSDGVVLSTKLAQHTAVTNTLANLVSSLGADVEALAQNEIIIAWDGNSTPDVTKIPAGVVIEYNNVEYTGTLAASSSTRGKVYWVGEEGSDVQTQYITSLYNGSYIWFDKGTTEIDLSDYKRKDDEIWLTEEEFLALEVKDPTKTYNVYEIVSEL